VNGDTLALTRAAAYVAGRSSVTAVDLSTGRARRIASYPDAGALVPSPSGTRLAVSSARHPTRLLGLPSGTRLGEVPRGLPAWLADGRLLVSGPARTRLYGTGLALVRTLPRLRVVPAILGTRAYGISRRRLVALDVESGRRRTVTTLPDPDTLALAPVPGAPRIDSPRVAPHPVSAARAACGVVR
jgi:hypothetical protein